MRFIPKNMINIRADQTGRILAYGDAGELPGSLPFSGSLPTDFHDNAPSGKYLFDGAAITENPDWVAPVPTE